jgi:hypothetical protein
VPAGGMAAPRGGDAMPVDEPTLAGGKD